MKNEYPNRAFDEYGRQTPEQIKVGVEINAKIAELFDILSKSGFNARESLAILIPEIDVRGSALAIQQAADYRKKEKEQNGKR